MLKAVVFDMDQTLLDINLSAFIAVLAKEESALLADIGRRNPLSMFAAYTAALLDVNRAERDNTCTNRELFDAAIERRGGVALSDPIIDAHPMKGAAKAIEAVLSRGLRIALLTNPSFGAACIECRMGWGQLLDVPFELVTTMENTRRVKPNPEYYTDALDELGLKPSEVLMVGNDRQRDFPTPDIGLQTAFVGRGTPVRATWCGRMDQFAESFDEIEQRFYKRAERNLIDLVQEV